MCEWHPTLAADGPTRAFQQRAHVFWECPCAQVVLQCLRERLGWVHVRPVHVWLLIPPQHNMRDCEWWVLALAALQAMVKLRRVFAARGAEQVRVKAHALLDFALRDFSASQLHPPPY